MKKNTLKAIIATGLAVAVMTGSSYAQNQQPSAKVTAQIGFINVIDELSVGTNDSKATIGGWVDILRNNLKTPNQKDVLIGVSLEVGLLTDTKVSSKLATNDVSTSSAGVEVRVLVDGVEARPGTVMFGRRTQSLSAKLQGIIDGCLVIDTNTWSVVIDPLCVQPEEIQLVLDTMNANAFNFIVPDLVSGVHVIQVQARMNLGASAQGGSAKARALIGNGSLTAESVRMIRNEDIDLP